jgi:hypothetical protein
VCVPEDLWERGLGETATRFAVHAGVSSRFGRARVRTRFDVERQVRINLACGGELVGVSSGGRRGFAVGEYSFTRRSFDRACPGVAGGILLAPKCLASLARQPLLLPDCSSGGATRTAGVRGPDRLPRSPHVL